jgi:hypothetical protein
VDWNLNGMPEQLGLDLVVEGFDYWPCHVMLDIPIHAGRLIRKFGMLSPHFMVVFVGKFSMRRHLEGGQVFHHLNCRRLFTGPAPYNKRYRRGTQLCKIQTAKHFHLRMCAYCAKEFTDEQTDRWGNFREQQSA